SRRRHTRSYGDWSSDVCSSDLSATLDATTGGLADAGTLIGAGTVKGTLSGSGIVEASGGKLDLTSDISASSGLTFDILGSSASRSEERRVGKEWRQRWVAAHDM